MPLAKRKVEFLPNSVRLYASVESVVASWRGHTSKVPAQYATGTAQHETGFTLNERDTEVSGYVSSGIFQLGTEEAHEAGMPLVNLLTLEGSVAVLANRAEHRLAAILEAAKLTQPTPDVWAYLAIAHNEGLGAALKSIAKFKLDWKGWKQRNPQLADMAKYGDDCISGGEKWTAALLSIEPKPAPEPPPVAAATTTAPPASPSA